MHRFDAGPLAGDQVDAFRIEIRNRAQASDLALVGENAGPGIGPIRHVRLGEARFQGSGIDAVDIGDRTVGRLRDGDEARHAAAAALVAFTRSRRVADRVRNQAPDRIVRPARATGPDAEETHVLRDRKARGDQQPCCCDRDQSIPELHAMLPFSLVWRNVGTIGGHAQRIRPAVGRASKTV